MPDLSGVGAAIGGFINPKPSNDEVVIKIKGAKVLGFTANSIQRSINTLADGFTYTISYDPNEPYSDYFDPFTYNDCDLYINDNLFIKGVSVKWSPVSDNSGTTMTLEVRSKSGDLLESPPLDGRLNYKNQTLKQLAEIILEPFGLTADFPNGDSDIIKKIHRDEKESAGAFLQRIAKSVGFIVNSSRIKTAPPGIIESLPGVSDLINVVAEDDSATDADLVFEEANIGGEPILTLKQGEQPLISVSATYDGTKRYSDFQANSQTKGNPSNTITVKDESITRHRPLVFDVDNIEQGGLEGAALWKRSRTLAESAPVTVTIDGWRDKNDNTVLENEIVTLYYPKVCIFQETRFLIEKVNLPQGMDGKTASLTLVLPQSYTKEYPAVDKFPWFRPPAGLIDIIGDIINAAASVF